MQLSIEKRSAAVLILVQESRLDAHNSGDLKTELMKQFESGQSLIIVDLQEVRFVDSSGLGVLVSGFKNASARSGNFILCGLQQQVKSMFELTRLHRVFDIYATSEEALSAAAQQP